ncbi:hypothetical protein O1L44_15560 [Streptomyces noursei]|nr:hypothetical protein [Streptomyces noursei]
MLRFHAGAEPHRARHMLLTVTNISDRTCTFAAQPYPCCISATTARAPSRPSRTAGRTPPSRCRPTAPPTPWCSPTPNPAGRAAGAPAQHGRKGVPVRGRTGRAHHPAQVGVDDHGPVRVDPDTAAVTYWQPSLADAGRW